MKELGLDSKSAAKWFEVNLQSTHLFITLSPTQVSAWKAKLGLAVRRCYFADSSLELQALKLNMPAAKVMANLLPDPGATMAGDFGEILTYIYHAVSKLPRVAQGVKKWRLKQDRNKPAPHSDVVHFILPKWPKFSKEDQILCSEVKTKSTKGSFNPISDAVRDCEKDRTSRLSSTLAWLKERAIRGDLDAAEIPKIERFQQPYCNPAPTKSYFAVAVICSSLVAGELKNVPRPAHADYSLLVMSVPDLNANYSSVYGDAGQFQ